VALTILESPEALPWWVWGGVGGIVLLILAFSIRAFPVKVAANPGGVRSGLGRLKLGRVAGLKDVKLALTRGLGGQIVARSSKDSSGARVVVASAALGRVEIDPGQSCTVHRGDVVEVFSPQGELCVIEILSGSPMRGLPGEPLFPDDLHFGSKSKF
jgi:hypothetical protein